MKTRSDDLVIFCAVADSGGFSAAAEQLDLQVAKVSRAIRRLETQLEVSLFNRTTRQVVLTEEGEQFIAQIRQGLNQIEQAEQQLQFGANHVAGRLNIDAASPFLMHQIIPHIADFMQAYPEVRLELTSNEGFVDLLERRTDIAIRIGQLEDSSLYATPLGSSPLRLVASPDYLKRNGPIHHPDALQSQQIIGFHGAKILNQWPLQAWQPNDFYLKASNGEAVRQLALAHQGIACLSRFMIHDDLKAGRLVPILNEYVVPLAKREQIHAVSYQSSQKSARIQAFVSFLKPRLVL